MPDHHVHASTDFKHLNILQRSTSASGKTTMLSLSSAVSVHTFTSVLAQLLPPTHSCLRGSSPVAPRVHPIYSNSADRLSSNKTLKNLLGLSNLREVQCCHLPHCLVFSGGGKTGVLCVSVQPTGRNSLLSLPARVFFGRAAELAHGSFLYPSGRH